MSRKYWKYQAPQRVAAAMMAIKSAAARAGLLPRRIGETTAASDVTISLPETHDPGKMCSGFPKRIMLDQWPRILRRRRCRGNGSSQRVDQRRHAAIFRRLRDAGSP